ncbi:ATP-grasp fold amidoligase family protein [Bradyrhizobium sp. URHC0002]
MSGISGIWERNGCSLQDLKRRASAMKSLLARLRETLWHWAPVYASCGHIFNFFETMSGYKYEKAMFLKYVGYELDLTNPKSLNQKIVWKKLFDRNPLLPPTSDKYLVREYVEKALGPEADKILVPLLYVGDDPRQIPFDTLPAEYVVKTNHDSGGTILVRTGENVDRQKMIVRLTKWLKIPYGIFKHEWAYWSIRRKVIVEALLREENGGIAQDYKFHVFHGTCKFIHATPKMDGERSGRRSLFTPDWRQLDAGWKYPKGPYISPPPRLSDMIRISEKLAAPFDYVRVDLFNPDDRIFFGELTHYHGSGREPLFPESFDFEGGSFWNIAPNYWIGKTLGS